MRSNIHQLFVTLIVLFHPPGSAARRRSTSTQYGTSVRQSDFNNLRNSVKEN